MVRKKLATVVAALGTLQAGLVSALGIGELTLQSALNQPLVAEIKLLNSGDLDETQVLVGLASTEDFINAGVSRDFFLTNFKFRVQLDGNGGGVIRLTTRKPVVEPYLNFLIETRWPSGRLLREYTVLLDLPIFSESQAREVETASSPRIIEQSSVDFESTLEPLPDQNQGGSNQFGGELDPGSDYRVGNDETLWVIAAKARPSPRVTVQQTMLGIQRLNPEAFANNNINRLKAGSVLRLPTEDELTDVSRRQAVDQVASQNRSFRSGDGSVDNKAQLDATRGSSGGGRDFGDMDRLSIATAGNSDNNNAGDGQGLDGIGSQALRDQLTLNQESLDKSKREKQELRSRLNDVQTKLETLQRLLELKDDQLAAMQSAQSDEQRAEIAQNVPTLETLDIADSDDAQLSGGGAASEPDADEVLDSELEGDEFFEEDASLSEPGLLNQLQDNLLYIGGAALLLLAGAAVVMRRRREEEEEFNLDDSLDDDDMVDVSFGMDDLDEPEEVEEPKKAPPSDNLLATNLAINNPLTAEFEEPIANLDETRTKFDAPVAAATAMGDTGLSIDLQPETGDAIAEADIYVAYGRYQQAIDLLRTAISQEPKRSDLYVKFLEVCVETRDKPSFQQQYMALSALGDNNALAEVKEMLSTVDGVADWLNDLPGADGISPNNFTDADMDAELIEGEELDLDLELDNTDNATLARSDLDFANEDDLSLDLDDAELDLDDDQLDLDVGDVGDFSALDLDEGSEPDNLGLDGDLDDISLDLDEGSDLKDDFDLELDDNKGDGSGLTFDLDSDDDGFDLDLDDDFDLDLADMDGENRLDELESEFGDTTESAALTPDALMDLDDDIDLSSDNDIALTEELDLSSLQEGQNDNVAEIDSDATVVPVNNANGAEEDFDFLSDTDEVATKLDLARAYIDMGDSEGAKDILDEVLQEGSDEQKHEADNLIERIA